MPAATSGPPIINSSRNRRFGLASSLIDVYSTSFLPVQARTLQPGQVDMYTPENFHDDFTLRLAGAGEHFGPNDSAQAPYLIEKRLGLGSQVEAARPAIRGVRPPLEQPVGLHPVQEPHHAHGI